MHDKNSTFTLEEVKQKFEEWRSNKKATSGRIPDELWRLSMELYPNYSINQIASTLNLKYTKLKAMLLLKPQSKKSHTPTFIEVTSSSTQSKRVNNASFTRLDGAKMNITFNESVEAKDLIHTFLSGEL